MTGTITSLPPLIEQPPGNNSSNPAGLPGITYQTAVLNFPQTWTALQTFPQGNISINYQDVIGLSPSASVDTTNASNITSGTLPAARLPNPSASTLGGVESIAAVAHNWITSISTSGVPAQSQPAFTDISGSVASTQMPALAGDVTTSAGAVATTISANAVTNAKMATMAAWTFKANNTSGAATPTDITIDGLTVKGTPAGADELIIWDVAGSALKKATVTSLTSATGVSSVGGVVGAVGVANGIEASGSNIQMSAARRTLPTRQIFLSGSGTYTTPANVLYIKVTAVGGGGGGSGGGTSTSGGVGGTGGNTTFGTTLIVANGGTGGQNGGGNGGTGGSASLGAAIGQAFAGGSGGAAMQSPAGSGYAYSGSGAPTPLGGSGGGGGPGLAGIAAITNTGSGGGGGGTSSVASVNSGAGGGAGGYVNGLITSPLATYSYAVGAAGTAGTAGTSGFAGGAGGSGSILVEEFYNS